MREMGKRGGKKGGPKGGRSRMNSLTPEQRKELARKAANKRWENARAKKKQASEKGTSIKKKNSP
jgi:hypothetical protein